MRVAYISVSDHLGGSEIVLLEVLKGVRRLRPGWKLHLILPGRGPLLARAEEIGVDCVIVPMPDSLARLGESGASRVSLAARMIPVALALPQYVRRVRTALDGARPEIVHTNGLKAHVVGARAAGAAKLVWHLHEYIGARHVTRSLLGRHQNRVGAMIANSRSVADDVSEALRPSVPLHVVPNAVDLAVFAPVGATENLDRRAGVPAAPLPVVRVGLVATFARWKGHDVFLEALAAIPPGMSIGGYVIGDAVYDTAGSQHSIDELKALRDRLGLRDRVAFTGFLPAAAAMRALDIVVHASTRPEPFGLVIAEAMACGRAVITSGTGGAGELVTPEHDALAHAPGDARSLAHCIERLATDPVLRRRLGENARQTASERFDSDRLARDIVAVYDAL
jgi:glycosyltransferase involved in cell wall biosynthesis